MFLTEMLLLLGLSACASGAGVRPAAALVGANSGGQPLSTAMQSLPACVGDRNSATGMRLAEPISARLPGDSVLSANGERRPLSDPDPLVVGFPGGASGFETHWVNLLGHRYGRFGMPRSINPALLTRIGEHQGVSVFLERGQDISALPDVVYVLNSECLFVPYSTPENMR